MKTYVTINDGATKYNTIDNAISSIDDDEIDVVDVSIWNENGERVDWQECRRNPYSNDFEFYAWGIVGYEFHDADEFESIRKINSIDILAEGYNCKKEAIESVKEFSSIYDVICVESWNQTVSENIGDRGEGIIVINKLGGDYENCEIINEFDIMD